MAKKQPSGPSSEQGRINIDIDPRKHKEFKVLCYENETTMGSVLRGFIEKYLNKKGKLKKIYKK